MFSKGRRKPLGKSGQYKTQIDDDEAEGGHTVELGGRMNTAEARYDRSTKAGTVYQSGERGSERGSVSLYRSDINSDYVINNACTIQDDLEHVNLLMSVDTNGFIRRVFAIFTGQMIFSTTCVAAAAYSPSLSKFQTDNFNLFYLAIVAYLVCDICLLCERRLSRQAPVNFIILFVATLCQGYILSMTTLSYNPESVLKVFLISTSTFIGMTLYGLFARKDVGVHGSILSAVVAGGIALAVVLTQFEQSDIIYLTICNLFVFIGLTFVAIDTQMILKERHWGISHEDYVVAALVLVIDFVNIFTHICKVVRKKKK